VVPADVEELAEGDPAAVAVENARRKALAVAARPGYGERTVLGADTVVAIAGEILPKPADEAAARRWLERLGGREHLVAGGICVAAAGSVRTASRLSIVRFRELSDEDVERYLATGEWRGRAGGYAIQGHGRDLVAAVEGEELNVVGLSAEALAELLPGLVTRPSR
jgi:septum formation protein